MKSIPLSPRSPTTRVGSWGADKFRGAPTQLHSPAAGLAAQGSRDQPFAADLHKQIRVFSEHKSIGRLTLSLSHIVEPGNPRRAYLENHSALRSRGKRSPQPAGHPHVDCMAPLSGIGTSPRSLPINHCFSAELGRQRIRVRCCALGRAGPFSRPFCISAAPVLSLPRQTSRPRGGGGGSPAGGEATDKAGSIGRPGEARAGRSQPPPPHGAAQERPVPPTDSASGPGADGQRKLGANEKLGTERQGPLVPGAGRLPERGATCWGILILFHCSESVDIRSRLSTGHLMDFSADGRHCSPRIHQLCDRRLCAGATGVRLALSRPGGAGQVEPAVSAPCLSDWPADSPCSRAGSHGTHSRSPCKEGAAEKGPQRPATNSHRCREKPPSMAGCTAAADSWRTAKGAREPPPPGRNPACFFLSAYDTARMQCLFVNVWELRCVLMCLTVCVYMHSYV